mmetsp:Transcript_42522/g.109310  ORF Transcript_42522/g.109310 Transcript_42522/m.109310 type:complete len:249 (-) Transcript_42522:316-1062(-)
MKEAPKRPPHTPKNAKKGTSSIRHCTGVAEVSSKSISDFDPTTLISKLKRMRRRLSRNVAAMQAMNVRHVSCPRQNELVPSRERRVPPMGAPNAALAPAAAPMETKSRLSWSDRKLRLNRKSARSVFEPWLKPAPHIAPRWTIGPSFPTGKPAAAANTRLTTFTIKVRMRSTFGTFTPFRYAFTSLTPDDAAAGSMYATTAVEMEARRREERRKAKYPFHLSSVVVRMFIVKSRRATFARKYTAQCIA